MARKGLHFVIADPKAVVDLIEARPRSDLPVAQVLRLATFAVEPWTADYDAFLAPAGPVAQLAGKPAAGPHLLYVDDGLTPGRHWEAPLLALHVARAASDGVSRTLAETRTLIISAGCLHFAPDMSLDDQPIGSVDAFDPEVLIAYLRGPALEIPRVLVLVPPGPALDTLAARIVAGGLDDRVECVAWRRFGDLATALDRTRLPALPGTTALKVPSRALVPASNLLPVAVATGAPASVDEPPPVPVRPEPPAVEKPVQPPRPPAPRRRWLAVAAACGLLAGGGALAMMIASPLAPPPPPAADSDPAAPSRPLAMAPTPPEPPPEVTGTALSPSSSTSPAPPLALALAPPTAPSAAVPVEPPALGNSPVVAAPVLPDLPAPVPAPVVAADPAPVTPPQPVPTPAAVDRLPAPASPPAPLPTPQPRPAQTGMAPALPVPAPRPPAPEPQRLARTEIPAAPLPVAARGLSIVELIAPAGSTCFQVFLGEARAQQRVLGLDADRQFRPSDASVICGLEIRSTGDGQVAITGNLASAGTLQRGAGSTVRVMFGGRGRVPDVTYGITVSRPGEPPQRYGHAIRGQ